MPNSNTFWLWFNAITNFLYFLLQSYAHWMFSYEYYHMARVIPFVLDDKVIPDNILKSNRAQFRIWCILITIVCVLFGLFVYLLDANYSSPNKKKLFLYEAISLLVLALLSTVVSFYLGLSIYRIKQLTTMKNCQVNTKIMTVHASIFGIFTISSLVVACAYFWFILKF